MSRSLALLLIVMLVACKSNRHKALKTSYAAILNAERKIHSAYEICPGTIAVNFSESYSSDKKLDSIFNRIIQTDRFRYRTLNGMCFDETGAFDLKKNDSLTRAIKAHLRPEYYIYGTHGYAKCKVKDVIFCLEECKSDIFAFTVEGFDTRKHGHPVICSEDSLHMSYMANYERVEKKIDELFAKERHAYSDNLKAKVLGNIDSFYFTYSDDYKWGMCRYDTTCFFPARSIVVLHKNGALKKRWFHELDLLGLPCD